MTASNESETLDQGKENPETPPPAAVAGAAEDAAARLAAAQKEAAGNYDKFVRAVADLDNYRKRALREKEEARQFGHASLLQDIVPVLDNLQLGLDHARAAASAEAKGVADGVAMVFGQLRAALEKHGLKEINPAAGAAFDPNLHEAVSHLPSADVAAEQVLQVVRAGYALNGRLLRPASVVVSSGPAQTGAGT